MKGLCKTQIPIIAILSILMFVSGCKKSSPPAEDQSRDSGRTDSRMARTQSDFQPGVMLQAAGKTIDIEVGHLVPHVCDWNNDGKKDLLVGQFADGAITLFLNIGTDEDPKLDNGIQLQAGDKPIRLDAG